MESQQVDHKIYKRADPANADAVGWAFYDKNTFQKYYFQFPELQGNEVRIKIIYTGLCQSDCHHARGYWEGDGKVYYPLVPGHEVVGIVTKVGPESKKYKIGDKVGVGPQRSHCGTCEKCLQGVTNCCAKMQTLYDPYFGGYATHIQLPEIQAYKIPDGLPDHQIAPLLCAGSTVYSPLARWGRAGQTCGVIGIGGLGHLAIQFANKLGMKVTAFTTSLDREAEFKAMGADRIAHSTNPEALAAEAGKFDVVINTLFVSVQSTFNLLLSLCKKEGHFIQVGAGNVSETLPVAPFVIIVNQLNIHGSLIGSAYEVEKMLQFCKDNKIYPIVEEFPFEEFPKAFETLEKGRPKYRCVVNIHDWAKKNGFDR